MNSAARRCKPAALAAKGPARSVLVVSAPRPPGKLKTLQEVLDSLGNVPLARVIADPPPGTATERDVAEIEAHDHRLCELVDGTLVEKAVGLRESMIAAILIGNLLSRDGD